MPDRPLCHLVNPDLNLTGFVSSNPVYGHVHSCLEFLVDDCDPVLAESLGMPAADPFPHDRRLTEPFIGLGFLV